VEPFYIDKNFKRVKLIFNPDSGANSESPVQLMDVIKEMQAWKFIPEAYLIKPDGDLPGTILNAMTQGIRLFVVCGGDGTVSSVARELSGKNATLGIIPTGTRNNIASSLGIPADIPAAIALLRTGRRVKVDAGTVACGGAVTLFLEVCSVGLVSALFPSGDDIQHGKLLRVGNFLATLITSPPARISLTLDDGQELHKFGRVLLISNMPYIIRHYKVGSGTSYRDGLLDVLFYDGLSKLDLMGHVLKGSGTDTQEDPRIQHFRFRRADIDTDPAMPVMADGRPLGEGRVHIEVQKNALAVMIAQPEPKAAKKQGESLEE
jgi:diacylglycerol kinase (ATP)